MSEYTANLEKNSRALDSNFSTPVQQSSLSEILQATKERSAPNMDTQHHTPKKGNSPLQWKMENRTGLPDGMKALLEAKSGYSMNDVRVNYNSSRPAQLRALAYTQGSEIHIAPGQEKHLAHEAWHVAQQKQGRVQPTTQLKGVNVNDDEDLEKEADERGKEMIEGESGSIQMKVFPSGSGFSNTTPIQMVEDDSREFGYYTREGKRKSRRVISMEQFGDRNRVHAVNPNKYRERLPGEAEDMIDEETGIWRPSQQEARPEDPPIYQPVRDAYHRAHNIYTCFSAYDNVPQNRLDGYLEVLTSAADLIKKFSVEYKATIRNFNNNEAIVNRKAAYTDKLERIRKVLVRLTERMLENYKLDNPSLAGMDNLALGDIKAAEGEELWRGKWWAAIQKVNGILSEKWKEHKALIKHWITERKPALPYMQENMVGDLDYIGSLAKGYKSAPKQYMHFLPEKFDVDANLDAPPLAVYAISQGDPIDRSSVKSTHILPLRHFEDAVRDDLQQVEGIDQGDPFEVFIQTNNVKDLMGTEHAHVKDAQKKEALSERFQDIENRIWWLKINHPDVGIHNLNEWLKPDGSRLKEHKLGEDDDEHHEYTDIELTRIELEIKRLEAPAAPHDDEAEAHAVAEPLGALTHPNVAVADMTPLDRLERLERHTVLQAPVPPAVEHAEAVPPG